MLTYLLIVALSTTPKSDTLVSNKDSLHVRDMCIMIYGPDRAQSEYYLDQLSKIGPSAVPFLIQFLNGTEENVRAGAIIGLRLFNESRSQTVPLLWNYFNRTNDTNEKCFVLESFFYLCDSRDTFLLPMIKSIIQKASSSDCNSCLLKQSIILSIYFCDNIRPFLLQLHAIVQDKKYDDEIRAEVKKVIWKIESK